VIGKDIKVGVKHKKEIATCIKNILQDENK
jgi:hypothetical protein